MTHSMKVGDMLHYSWGWEQVNCELYQVTKVTPSSVVIQRITSRFPVLPDPQVMGGYLVPTPGSFMIDEPLMTKRVSEDGRVRMKYGLARLWDGQPKYSSWYG